MSKKKGAVTSDDAKTADATPDATKEAKPFRKKKSSKPKKSAAAHKQEIERRERMAEALEFRRQGYTYQQIADEMELDKSTVFRYVNEAIAEIPAEKAEMVRSMELDRLDHMQQTLFGQIEGGRLDAIDGILRIMDRRARYLRLYQDGDGGAADEFMAMASQRFAEMMAADKPILRPDEPIPASPVL